MPVCCNRRMCKQHPLRWKCVLTMCMVGLLWGAQAWAALGRTPLHRSQDPAAQGAPVWQQSPLAGTSCSVSVGVLPSGTVVREYINAAGQVFAVSWAGPLLPDLAALMGDGFTEYQQAAQRQRAAGLRGAMGLQKPGLIMVSRGRMGQFEGYAYVPSLVPADVDIHALLP